VSVNPQMMGLRGGADIVVATPGRLLDLMERNALRLDAVQALVLDEADRLLDLGFAAERERVLAAAAGAAPEPAVLGHLPAGGAGAGRWLLHDARGVEAASRRPRPSRPSCSA
jgi:ATP-dependent RNA helicase RhlE